MAKSSKPKDTNDSRKSARPESEKAAGWLASKELQPPN
jgi:hypothetical protein